MTSSDSNARNVENGNQNSHSEEKLEHYFKEIEEVLFAEPTIIECPFCDNWYSNCHKGLRKFQKHLLREHDIKWNPRKKNLSIPATKHMVVGK